MDLTLITQYFPETWSSLMAFFGGHAWLLIALTILTLTLLVDSVQRRANHFFESQCAKRQQMVLSFVLSAAVSPISFYIWLTGSVLVITTIMYQFQFLLDFIPYIEAFKSTVSVIAIAWFAMRFTRLLEEHLKELEHEPNSKWDSVTVEATAKILKLTIFVITGLIVLNAFGVELTGLIAFGGMGGIAVGFAAKDILGNIFGGLMLYMDKPFKVGDWVRSPDQEIEGIVENIGWRMTVIRTFDKRPLYVPNGTFANISIENPSRMTNRRIYETIGIRYDDMAKAKIIVDNIRSMLQNHPEIAQDQTLIVNLLEFGASSVNIMVYTFTKTTNWIRFHEIKEDVMLKIADIIEKEQAEMAFPTTTIHLAKDKANC